MDHKVIIIAALDKNRLIAKDEGIPWNIPSDMKHFSTITTREPSVVIMGRKTYQNIVKALGKPLSRRINFVLSQDPSFKSGYKEVPVFTTIENALESVPKGIEHVFIIGGQEIYQLGLKYAHEMILTHIDIDIPKDDTCRFFPEFNHQDWLENRGAKVIDEKSGISYHISVYTRKEVV